MWFDTEDGEDTEAGWYPAKHILFEDGEDTEAGWYPAKHTLF